MRTSTLLHAAAALAVSFAGHSQAAEVAYDFVVCTHGRHTLVEGNADIAALGVENWGIVASSSTKEWEGATTHCAGYVRIMGSRPVGKGVCKWFLAAGDTAVGEFEYPVIGEPVFTWLTGTGRLKGILGGGSFKEMPNGRPADVGTSQGCRRDWGRYSAPGAK